MKECLTHIKGEDDFALVLLTLDFDQTNKNIRRDTHTQHQYQLIWKSKQLPFLNKTLKSEVTFIVHKRVKLSWSTYKMAHVSGNIFTITTVPACLIAKPKRI